MFRMFIHFILFVIIYEAWTLHGLGVSDTDTTTPTLVITLNYVIFSNY